MHDFFIFSLPDDSTRFILFEDRRNFPERNIFQSLMSECNDWKNAVFWKENTLNKYFKPFYLSLKSFFNHLHVFKCVFIKYF